MGRFFPKEIKSRWVQGAIMAVAGAVSLGLLVPIWLEVNQRLKEMNVSKRDNVIWTITQLEVELLELEKATLGLHLYGEQALPELHRRFNVYYSRVGTLTQSPLYRTAIHEAGELDALNRLDMGLSRLLPLVDGPDADLVRQRAILLGGLAQLSDDTRRIVTNANYVLATNTENARNEATQLVLRLGIISLILFTSLLGLALLFSRLYVIYKRRAKENLATTQRLATVIQTSPDAIVVTDAEGRVQEFNSAASHLLGYDSQQAQGADFSTMLCGADKTPALLPLKGAAIFRERMNGCTQAGHVLPLEVSQGATSLGKRPVYVYFLRDISDRLEAEQALKTSLDKAVAGEQAKAHFLAVMSHEMRTPLNGILGVVELMRDQLTTEKNRHYLSLLERSGKVLLEHVNEVLDLTEIEARGITLNEAAFNLDALVEEVAASMRPAAEMKGNSLVLTKVPDGLGFFQGDAMRLRQVVANLLSNAVKFTEDGVIELMVSTYPSSFGAMLEIQVIDTGVGIAEPRLEAVFDDFVRVQDDNSAQVEGTGLGLGIVRRIVSAMQGEIGVESEQSEGSLFWVRLPLSPIAEAQAFAIETPETHAAVSGAMDILIVEDNPTNRFVLKELLEQDGHLVNEAENGRVGVDMARARRFDAILMDINMPVMGGVEATRDIRSDSLNAETRIVALTAHVLDQDAQLYREVGMDAVVSKPISRRSIRNVLSGQGQEPRSPQHNVTLDRTILDQLSQTMPSDKVHLVVEGAISEGDAFVDVFAIGRELERDQLQDRVHNLSGTAAMIGAVRLRNTLSQLETRLRTQGAVDLAMWPEAVRVLWQETRRQLVDYADALGRD